jgi:hypothetical protein
MRGDFELSTELSDKAYGAWVSPNGVVYSVERSCNHSGVAGMILKLAGDRDYEYSYYRKLFKAGFVRIVWKYRSGFRSGHYGMGNLEHMTDFNRHWFEEDEDAEEYRIGDEGEYEFDFPDGWEEPILKQISEKAELLRY